MKTFIKTNLAKILVTGVFVVALSFVFGPALYASFQQIGGPDSQAFGFGYGYGYGFDGSGYSYGFGYGYGYKEVDGLSGYGFFGSTGKAQNVSVTPTQTTATFNYSTDYSAVSSIVYGLGTPLVAQNATTTAPEADFTIGDRTVTLTGLTPATTYNYEVRTVDAGGTTWVEAGQFTTLSNTTDGGIIIFGGAGGSVAGSVGSSNSSDGKQDDSGVRNTLGCQLGDTFSPITGVKCTSSNSSNNNLENKAFRVNLSFQQTHPDVLRLQRFLNTHGSVVAAPGLPGSLNNETTYMGPATFKAVIKYQHDNGILPNSGYFGPLTRAFVNTLLGY